MLKNVENFQHLSTIGYVMKQKLKNILGYIFNIIREFASKMWKFAEPLRRNYMKIAAMKYGRLIRADKPSVYLMLCLPTWSAAIMASRNGYSLDLLLFCILFLMGSVMMRSIGCIANDIADRKIDGKVGRTKYRPITSGEVSVKEAIFIAGLMSACTAGMLFFLPQKSTLVCCVAFIMTCLYPYSKRFTYFPQLVLGLTFNTGIPIAWFCFTDESILPMMMLYIGFVLVTIAYDTVYACQDVEDDKKIGVKSLALYLYQKEYSIKSVVWQLYRISAICFGIAGLGIWMKWQFFAMLGLATYILYKDLEELNLENPNDCAKHFKQDIILYILLIFIGIVTGK